jgi:hypothetical protein
MSPSSDSVYQVNQLNVIDSGAASRIALSAGNSQAATAGSTVSTAPKRK